MREDPEVAILEDVDWAVAPGDFWVVAGPPGSGKSHMLESAAGLLPPVRGECRVFGLSWLEMTPGARRKVRQRIGFVFADGGRLFGQLTVAENVALALCYHEACEFGRVRERVESVLERTGVTAWADRYPQRLSRGLRQRVALARALALGPDVLFLDNPLSGLDAGQSRWWSEFLRQWSAAASAVDGSPHTLVVASDDLRPWLTAARQFGVIRGRRWEPLGGADAVRGSRDGLVRDLLAAEEAG